MRRATRDNQKEERRQALRDTAWSMFQERSYEAINVQEVAERAGLAKGTVYLYFRTKEELFLSVQEQQFDRWFQMIDLQLSALGKDCGAAALAASITDSLVAQPAMIRLFAISHAVLERNASPAAIMHLKQALRVRLATTGTHLETCLPFLSPGDGARVLLQGYALVVGIQSLADTAPLVKQVLESEPELEMFTLDFAREFTTAFTLLLHGWQAEHKGKTPKSKA